MKYALLTTIFALMLALPAHAIGENQHSTSTLTEEIKELNIQIESLEKDGVPQKHLDDLYAKLAAKEADHDARTKYLESLE